MKLFTALLTLTLFPLIPLPAQDAAAVPVAGAAAQAEIRTLSASLLDAVNKADFDRMVTYLRPDVVITYQNAEVARGRDAVKTFQLRMTSGSDKIVESFRAEIKADELTILPGGITATATGSSAETYKMAHGPDLALNGRWTATLVKDDGQWLVGALHFSTNVFQNPLVAATKKAGVTASIGSILIGLIVGWLLGRKRIF